MSEIDSDAQFSMTVEQHDYKFKTPFAITGYVWEVARTVRMCLSQSGTIGQGEGMGVYYLDEDAKAILSQLREVESDLSYIKSVDDIQDLLPPGGARNALDCAYWDYIAKRDGVGIWTLLNINPKPLTTVFTLGIAEPEVMAQAALDAIKYPFLKLKLGADRPVERVEAIRKVRPDVRIIIDVNQGWRIDELKEYAPKLQSLGVEMLEQPLPRGGDEDLDGYKSPIPLGADESCLHTGEFEVAAARYDVINIKLDKTGGLTEALKLAHLTKERGMGLMVGNMGGTSLSMAPSSVIGQMCDFVDIDGPLLLSDDIDHGLVYKDGGVVAPPSSQLWG